MILMPACVSKTQNVYVDNFCHVTQKIELSDIEIAALERLNREKIRLYNCVCVHDEKSCQGITLLKK